MNIAVPRRFTRADLKREEPTVESTADPERERGAREPLLAVRDLVQQFSVRTHGGARRAVVHAVSGGMSISDPVPARPAALCGRRTRAARTR
ncbi:hypothetical protein GCM10009608_02640 [Pseudonocardia alaniniphila]